MFKSFQRYVEAIKPVLDEAYRRSLSGLLDGVPMRDGGSLIAGLEAGKKIRGCLACMINDALGGSLRSAIPRAVAVELIQAATLIHDDFVDQDTVRRGRPAVWTLEGARRAVLIGDVIFAAAIKMMSDLGCEDGAAVSDAIAQVSKGALQEPLDPGDLAGEIACGKVSRHLYDKIIRLKTGILFGSACLLGAIAAGTGEELRAAAYRYGSRIGDAYQIADDLEDVKQHLSKRLIHPPQMAALAPALLYFVGDAQPLVINILKGERAELNGQGQAFFTDAARLMAEEIEERLRSAVSEIEGTFPSNPYVDLVRSAPADIIRMFSSP